MLTLLLTAALCLGCLTGCVSNALPDGYDEITVTAIAELTVEYINDGDYEGLAGLCAEASGLTAESIGAAADKATGDKGGFAGFGSVKLGADSGNARAVVRAEYENGTLEYILVLNSGYEITSLKIK